MSAHKYKLVYFNLMGRAEPIRLIFAFKGIEYEDSRIERSEWPALKQTTPFGKIPILYVNEKPLCQSVAISRYLGHSFGMAGKSEWENALCDQYVDGLVDVFNMFNPWFKEKKDLKKKEEIWKGVTETGLKPFFDRYETFLKENGTGHFVGEQTTWADLYIFHALSWWSKTNPELFEGKANISNFMWKVYTNPGIKEWMERRPKTTH